MASLRAGDNYTNITTATTTAVKASSGNLKAIVVNAAVTTGTITIYDNTAASGTKIATITFPATLLANQVYIPYNVHFSTGLTIVTTGTADITAVWN